jgi:hypothetical protein
MWCLGKEYDAIRTHCQPRAGQFLISWVVEIEMW